jgi:hypothetical protein
MTLQSASDLVSSQFLSCLTFTVYTLMFTGKFPASSLFSLPSISADIQHFLNPYTNTSGKICCYGLDPLAQWFYFTVLRWCKNMVSTKSHSEYNCFKWSLKGLFTRMCYYKTIPPCMIRRSVFTAWITALASSFKWPLNACSTSTPCFLNNTLHLLLQTICNQFHITSFSHPFLSLTHNY